MDSPSPKKKIVIDDSFVDSELINHKGQKYPRILIHENSIFKSSSVPEHLNDLFLIDTKKSFAKIFLFRLRTRGFVSALNFIQDCYKQQEQETKISNLIRILYFISTFLLWIRFVYQKVLFYFYPFDKFSDEELLEKFSPNASLSATSVRVFSWHKKSLRCAVALNNNLIYVHSADDRRPINHIVCLKYFQQRNVSSMQWHPIRDDLLAVTSQSRVLLWTLASDLSKFFPDQKNVQMIESGLKSPLTDLSFNHSGNLIICCSPRNSTLSVIRIDVGDKSPKVEIIRKLWLTTMPPQFFRLNLSPDPLRIMAHTTRSRICMFETQRWAYGFWPIPTGDGEDSPLCQTSAWSRPSGRILLFVPTASSCIYALPFYDQAEPGDVGGGPDHHCTVVLDVSTEFGTGSHIRQICWDSKSRHLAVSFQDRQDVIAIYATTLKATLQIRPWLLVSGQFQSGPVKNVLATFHDGYIDPGSLLTVCWSNGHVTHVPLPDYDGFTEMDKITETKSPILTEHLPEQQHHHSIRSLTSLCNSFVDSSVSSMWQTPEKFTSYSRSNGTPGKNPSVIRPVMNGGDVTQNGTLLRRPVLYSTRMKFD